MKSKWLFPICALCLTLAVSSCTKDGSVNNTPVGTFECKIAGNPWKASSVTAFVLKTDQTGIWSKTLNITGTGPEGELLTIAITDIRNAEAGDCLNNETYYAIGDDKAEENHAESAGGIDFSSGSICSIAYPDNTGYFSEQGRAVVTDCGGLRVSGIFEFDMWTVENGTQLKLPVTEGKFTDVAYILK